MKAPSQDLLDAFGAPPWGELPKSLSLVRLPEHMSL
jgi:hypothetical protein